MAANQHFSLKTTADQIKDKGENNETVFTESDSNQLLKYLPAEVWYHLSDKLDDPTTQNLTNSSPFFRNLFLSKRTNFLYQPAIETILPQLPTNDRKSFLLSNRFVCQKWNQKICALTSRKWENLEKRVTNLQMTNFVPSITNPNYVFNNTQTIEKFLTFFHSTHPTCKNPFVGRSITIDSRYLDGPLNPEDFFAATTQLLKKYGVHILNCEIQFARMQHDIPEKLHELLCLLPNLKCLELLYKPIAQHHNFSFEYQQHWGLNIAKFRNLKYLKLHWLPGFMSRRLMEISSSTLSILEITPNPNSLENSGIIFPNRLNTKWVLKKLHLDFSRGFGDVRLSLYQVFKQVENNFRETLKHLCLDLPSNQTMSSSLELRKLLCDAKHYRLDLPKVTKVELKVMNNYYSNSLNFILGLSKTLEELTISVHEHEDGSSFILLGGKQHLYLDEGKEIIEWVGCQERMHKSNIWELFPKLKRINWGENHIIFNFLRVYSRRRWVKEMQKQKQKSSLDFVI